MTRGQSRCGTPKGRKEFFGVSTYMAKKKARKTKRKAKRTKKAKKGGKRRRR